MTGSEADATESDDERRAILDGLRALDADVTDWSLTCDASGTLADDDEADETEPERDGVRDGRLASLTVGRRGPVV